MEDLPSEFDLVVVGTGFSESIIAAAASRIGKTVLHVDENDYYCGFWASFNLDSFMSHLDKSKTDENMKCRLRNCEERWFEFTEEQPDVNGWSKEKILQEKRRFNIDLIPKMNYCNGKLVDLLISSNICRYTEFRAVDKVLTVLNGAFDIVPGSRADIFTKKNVSIVEKRLLMKFMTQCMEYDTMESDAVNDFKEFHEDGKFIELMKQQRLTDNLIHYILHSMCMGNETTTFKEGIERIRTYLTSIGRYGNTPFLFPMYGCGEIPQCFCRLAAVFGGIYCLGHAIRDVKVIESNEEQVVSLNFDNKTIQAKKLVHGLGSNVLEEQIPHDHISRGILITSSPIGGSTVNSEMDGGGVVLLYHPIEGRPDGVTLIQLSHFSGCVPKGLYLVHLSISYRDGAKKDLEQFVDSFFSKDFNPEGGDDVSKPTILFSSFFEIPSTTKSVNESENQNGPIYVCSGPFSELDYDESIRQTKLLYEKMYPGEEFLPKAPEPEEIIIGDEDATEGSVNLGVLADLIEEVVVSGSSTVEKALEASESPDDVEEAVETADAEEASEISSTSEPQEATETN